MLFWRRPENEKKLGGFWELPEHYHLPQAIHGRNLDGSATPSQILTMFLQLQRLTLAVVPAGYSWLSTDEPLKYLFSTSVRKALHVISKIDGV